MRLCPQISLCLLVIGLVLVPMGSESAIVISRVMGDGRPINVDAISGGEKQAAKTVQLESDNRSLTFFFNQTNALGIPSDRLRYKLDGYDEQWRDLVSPVQMRMFIAFYNDQKQVLATESFSMVGESPGWQGTVSSSDFIQREERVTAPPGASGAGVVFISSGPMSVIGIAAVDAVWLRIERVSEEGQKGEYDLSLQQGTDLDQPLGAPDNWVRWGDSASMARLDIRNSPTPHPVLKLEDSSGTGFALWRADKKNNFFPVKPGDQLTLNWECAHSIGLCGPGTATYGTLKPGRYWFRVTRARPNGEVFGSEASVMIHVSVPMLQRPIFWGGIAILASMAGLLAGRALQKQRMRRRLAVVERMHALERERARIARDLHDNLGSGLTEIAMKSDLVCYEAKQYLPPESFRHLERICQSATELTRSVDEMVWAVNPANDTLRNFVNYLTQSTEHFLSASKLSLSLDIPSNLPNVELSGKKRHTIFLAVREALNNAVKHSQATRLKLLLRWHDPSLTIVVEDNGCGFVAGALPLGVHEGLEGMRLRLDEIGGRFELTSQPGAGTQIKLTVCLSDNSK